MTEIEKYRKRRQRRLDARRADEEIWRTTEKGKHYALETETGEVTKGNIGHKTIDRAKGMEKRIGRMEERYSALEKEADTEKQVNKVLIGEFFDDPTKQKEDDEKLQQQLKDAKTDAERRLAEIRIKCNKNGAYAKELYDEARASGKRMKALGEEKERLSASITDAKAQHAEQKRGDPHGNIKKFTERMGTKKKELDEAKMELNRKKEQRNPFGRGFYDLLKRQLEEDSGEVMEEWLVKQCERQQNAIQGYKDANKVYREMGSPPTTSEKYKEFQDYCRKVGTLDWIANSQEGISRAELSYEQEKEKLRCRREWDKGNKNCIEEGKEQKAKEWESRHAKEEQDVQRLEKEFEETKNEWSKEVLRHFPSGDKCETVDDVNVYLSAKGYFQYGDGGEPENGDEEAEIGIFSYMPQEQPKGVNLEGMDKRFVKPMATALDDFFEKFPKLSGRMQAMKTSVIKNGAVANCSTGENSVGVVRINKAYFGDGAGEKLEKAWEQCIETNFHPKGTAEEPLKGVVYHEFGHAIVSVLSNGDREKYRKINNEIFKKTYDHFKAELGEEGARSKLKGLGKYSTKNVGEFVAECFCDATVSKEPNEIAVYATNLLKNKMKRNGLL